MRKLTKMYQKTIIVRVKSSMKYFDAHKCLRDFIKHPKIIASLLIIMMVIKRRNSASKVLSRNLCHFLFFKIHDFLLKIIQNQIQSLRIRRDVFENVYEMNRQLIKLGFSVKKAHESLKKIKTRPARHQEWDYIQVNNYIVKLFEKTPK